MTFELKSLEIKVIYSEFLVYNFTFVSRHNIKIIYLYMFSAQQPPTAPENLGEALEVIRRLQQTLEEQRQQLESGKYKQVLSK